MSKHRHKLIVSPLPPQNTKTATKKPDKIVETLTQMEKQLTFSNMPKYGQV